MKACQIDSISEQLNPMSELMKPVLLTTDLERPAT